MGKSSQAESARGAVRLRRAERMQLEIVTQCADDFVGPSHPVRTVMAVVEKLDVNRFCEPIRAREGVAGRDATDPRLLVALWLYACVRGIGSARELERRCEESAPFRWLCGGVSVNHRLLSDFRTDHGDALDGLFTQVIATLVDKKLVRVSRISQDGVRIRVSAGSNSFRREERLQILLEEAKKQVLELRRQLESPTESAAATARQKAARTRAAQSRQQRIVAALAEFPEFKR
jgi:transposase